MIRSSLSLLAAGALVLATGTPVASASTAVRPSLFHITLQAQSAAPGASGDAQLRPGRTPFGMALTSDGHFIFDIEVTVAGLPPAPSAFGAYSTYAVWASSADLTETKYIGPLRADGPTRGSISFSKFVIFVTAEGATPGAKWKGPVLLRGFSPSTWLENLGALTLMNGGQTPP